MEYNNEKCISVPMQYKWYDQKELSYCDFLKRVINGRCRPINIDSGIYLTLNQGMVHELKQRILFTYLQYYCKYQTESICGNQTIWLICHVLDFEFTVWQ